MLVQNAGPIKSKFTIFLAIFYIALISPLLPKFGDGDSFNITFLELTLIPILLLAPWVLLKSLQLNLMKPLSLAFVGIVFSTLVGSFYYFDEAGLFRLIKLLLYFQLSYIGYKIMTFRRLLWLGYAGMAAMILNLAFYFLYQVPKFGYDNWNVEAISSGFANKFISVTSFELGTIMTGAHGVWLTYCLLSCAILFSAISHTNKKALKVLGIVALLLANTAVSVSREGFIGVLILLALSSISYINTFPIRRRLITYKILSITLLFGVTTLITVMASFKFGIFEKLAYTTESISSNGTEGNVQIRLNSWGAYFTGLMQQPLVLLTGVGWSNVRFGMIQELAKTTVFFVRLPESLFFTFFSYGGFISLIAFTWFYTKLTVISKKSRDFRFISFFLIAILPGSLFSGAALISDLVMCHLFLVIGFIAQQYSTSRRSFPNEK